MTPQIESSSCVMIRMESMMESYMPPGFRFHPTEEELVGYYLQRKIDSMKNALDVIVDIDLYKMEPWDIQARCKLGYDEQNEWYFFSHKDRKYPTGTRTNRATAAGFWKATGRDKAVLSKNRMIGMRKTLVFYKGRAPNGRKTDWIMHEYRLQNFEQAPPQEEGWVVCRAFKKPIPNQRPQGYDSWTDQTYNVNSHTSNKFSLPRMNSVATSNPTFNQMSMNNFFQPNLLASSVNQNNTELPQLDHSPSFSPYIGTKEIDGFEQDEDKSFNGVDWKTLDGFLVTQVTTDKPNNVLSSAMEYSYPTTISRTHGLEASSHLLGSFTDS